MRWFHCGGIFAELSATTSETVIEAMEAAHAAGTVISYDLNFRPSLWQSQGGTARAMEVNRRIAPLVDVMLGNEEDFTAALGFDVPDVDDELSELDPAIHLLYQKQYHLDYFKRLRNHLSFRDCVQSSSGYLKFIKPSSAATA